MKRRDLGFLGVGLFVGLMVGTVLISSSESLRSSLFGTAGLTPNAEPAYYLLNMQNTRELLDENYTDERSQIDTAMTNIDQLRTADDFAQAVRDTQGDVDFVVSRAFTAITGAVSEASNAPALDTLPQAVLNSTADGNVSTCLSLDENPYNLEGYTLYLYLQIPSTQVGSIPENWERLDEPKDNALYWERLACQSLIETQARRPGR